MLPPEKSSECLIKIHTINLLMISSTSTIQMIGKPFLRFSYFTVWISERTEGSLLPLWRFQYEKTKRMAVTCMAWCPGTDHDDAFVVGYGSFDYAKQGKGYLVYFRWTMIIFSLALILDLVWRTQVTPKEPSPVPQASCAFLSILRRAISLHAVFTMAQSLFSTTKRRTPTLSSRLSLSSDMANLCGTSNGWLQMRAAEVDSALFLLTENFDAGHR